MIKNVILTDFNQPKWLNRFDPNTEEENIQHNLHELRNTYGDIFGEIFNPKTTQVR